MSKHSITVKSYFGKALDESLPELIALRSQILGRYVSEQSDEVEKAYLDAFAASPDAIIVLAKDGDKTIGSASGLPLEHQIGEIKQPILDAKLDSKRIFFFGESVLLPEYRGFGIGVRFFNEREAFARSIGRFQHVFFCALNEKNALMTELEDFWLNRGYSCHPELMLQLPWSNALSPTQLQQLVFWSKPLYRR